MPRTEAPSRLTLRLLVIAAVAMAVASGTGAATASPAQPVAVEGVTLESRDGPALHSSLWRAARPAAGLLIVHGLESHAGWFERSGTPAQLAAAGITVLAYDRRGAGRSGGARGHATSAAEFLDDLEAAHAELARILAAQGAAGVPLHALANCFGTRILLPYAERHPGAFASLVLTAPAAKMSRAADYGPGEKLRILLSPAERRFATPVEDELFVPEGPALDWIRADPLALREVTAGFLRATARLTREMRRAARRLDTPALVVLGKEDAMVDNTAIRSGFVARYRGPIEVLELDAAHYVDFTERQPELAAALVAWIHRHGAEGSAR